MSYSFVQMCVCVCGHIYNVHTHPACLCDGVEFMWQIRAARINSPADSLLIECSPASAALCLPNDGANLRAHICSCAHTRRELVVTLGSNVLLCHSQRPVLQSNCSKSWFFCGYPDGPSQNSTTSWRSNQYWDAGYHLNGVWSDPGSLPDVWDTGIRSCLKLHCFYWVEGCTTCTTLSHVFFFFLNLRSCRNLTTQYVQG